jgi:hypothetical protein
MHRTTLVIMPLATATAAFALLVGFPAQAADDAGPAAEPGVVQKVEGAVTRGAHAAAYGVERGVQAAASGVERGAKATARAVQRGAAAAASGVARGARATGEAADRVARRVGPDDDTAPATR